MLLGRVVGLIVATPKVGELAGTRFAVLQPVGADLEALGRPLVAVDTVGAAEGQLVFTASAATARAARDMAGRPVDLAVVGIVDELSPADGAGRAGGEAR
jgi:ethanolamine utilization protein EutN